ncbi:hypothetical protein LINPERPRIM_LOCUS30539 [Linum perenne]
MTNIVDLIVHYGGRMDVSGNVAKYVGGRSETIRTDKDYMSYVELHTVIGELYLKHKVVECIWYLEHDKSLSEGLHRVLTNQDAIEGLHHTADNKWVMTVYFEGTFDDGYTANNEEADIGPIEDDLHLDSLTINSVGHVGLGGPEVEPQQDVVESDSMSDDESVYRGSEDSDHILENVSSDDEINDMYDAAPRYDPGCDHSNIEFTLGMKFKDPTQFKHAVVKHALYSGASLRWTRSGKTRCEAICRKKTCRWSIYGAWYAVNKSFLIKRLGEPHSCPRAQSNNQATAKWIAYDFLEQFRINPDWDVNQIVAEVRLRYGIEVTPRHCYRAKKAAEDMLNGTVKEEYKNLRRYVLELIRADPSGRFILEVDPIPTEEAVYFKRIYVGFSSLRKGFLGGCRKMFGLDGCFLKGEVAGMLLAAVGKDGNNQVYPIAWAIVEGENTNSWSWFIQTLMEDLNIEDGRGWSVVSDQQKVGLINALDALMPYAKHRKCARHVFANWKTKHTSDKAREAFWGAVYSCNETDWDNHCKELQQLEAANTDGKKPLQDFMVQNPKTFCRAFLSDVPKCDSVESNICETFNGVIVKCRMFRIIEMLEEIRLYVMKRIVKINKMFKRIKDTLCPRIREIIERGKIYARNCFSTATLDMVCEVKEYGLGFVVDLNNRTCSCGYYTLSGIPCVHAVAAISYLRLTVEDFVHELYKCARVAKAYGYGVPAIVGRQAWPKADGYAILPPPGRRMPGSPKKAHRKELAELQGVSRKSGPGMCLRRYGMVMHCRNCSKPGHNARACPDKGVDAHVRNTNPPITEVNEDATHSRNVRRRIEDELGNTAEVQPLIQPDGDVPQRRKNRCGTCGNLGHNARKCPTKHGVQVVTMNETDRRVVDREVAIAQNGVGVTYFPHTGNTYFATMGGTRTRGGNADVGPSTRGMASTMDQNVVVGPQPPRMEDQA